MGRIHDAIPRHRLKKLASITDHPTRMELLITAACTHRHGPPNTLQQSPDRSELLPQALHDVTKPPNLEPSKVSLCKCLPPTGDQPPHTLCRPCTKDTTLRQQLWPSRAQVRPSPSVLKHCHLHVGYRWGIQCGAALMWSAECSLLGTLITSCLKTISLAS